VQPYEDVLDDVLGGGQVVHEQYGQPDQPGEPFLATR